MAAAALPVLDMTGPETIHIPPAAPQEEFKDEEAIKAVGDRNALFQMERTGWKGYVEWEEYPEKKAAAHKILTSQSFPGPPEYQLAPIPGTNPVLAGERWKLWHAAVGGELRVVPDDSWKIVLEEKHPDMLHILQFPYNGEPPKRLVTSKPVTPNPLHFVRNHGGIPIIDKKNYSFLLDGLVANPQSFTLDDLMDEKRFPRIKKHVTMQCSGTRRVEQFVRYPGQGDELPQAPWAEGAIGTAEYEGVSLKKVIKACGGLVDGAKHLEFFGADTYFKDNEVMNYRVSVPWSKVKANEVLLAWNMNGEPLPRIHGYPLRIMVFGYIGARSVKWLYRVKAIRMPTRAPVQSKEYLYFPQQIGKHNMRLTDGIQIQEMPVSSAIMSPWTKQLWSTRATSGARVGRIPAEDAGLSGSSSRPMGASAGGTSPRRTSPRSASGRGGHGNLIYPARWKAGSTSWSDAGTTLSIRSRLMFAPRGTGASTSRVPVTPSTYTVSTRNTSGLVPGSRRWRRMVFRWRPSRCLCLSLLSRGMTTRSSGRDTTREMPMSTDLLYNVES